MRIARVIILLALLANIALIVFPLLGGTGLPGTQVWGWFFSPRIEKEAYFSISGQPFDHNSWSSRWGVNRPVDGRSHAILSEIEVRIQHESRSGLVVVSVTGDSEAEVDACIQTLASDVKSTYSTSDPLAAERGYLQGGSDVSASTIFWRQRYQWLLIANAVVFFVLWFSVRLKKNQIAVVGGNGG